MAIRYDPPLISTLAGEVRGRWKGCRVAGVWLDSSTREAWVSFDPADGDDESLVFLLHPAAGHALCVPGSPPRPREARAGWYPFRGLLLSTAEASVDQRLLVLEVAGGRGALPVEKEVAFRLYVELHTNQWNAVLARGGTDRIEGVLWSRRAGGRSLRAGAVYRPPEGARRWADRPPTKGEWLDTLGPVEPGGRRDRLLSSAAWTSSINVDWILGAAADDPDPVLLESALLRYGTIRGQTGGEAWLLNPGSAGQPYPFRLTDTAIRCESLFDAMRQSAEDAGARLAGTSPDAALDAAPGEGDSDARADDTALVAELERRIARVRRRRAALARQLEGDDPERLRELGHLLLARQSDVPRGASAVSLEGFDGSTIEVELDPRLDAVRNAEALYDRARRRERAAAALPARIGEATDRLFELEAARKRVLAEGVSEDLWKAAGGRPTAGSHGAAPGAREARFGSEPLPYRRFRSSSGLEIRVGRSSRGNDDLTFRHSSPDDIWLHARQAAGAHVILRWDRRDQQPPRADLSEAAALAAIHSEARHSRLVPVDWTRRKYVRKPRKAPPGTVVPERVSTMFVEPDPEIGKRLTIDD